MTANPIHITLVTLGVSDVQASAAFYEKLGLKRAPASQEAVVFFDLWEVAHNPHAALREDGSMEL